MVVPTLPKIENEKLRVAAASVLAAVLLTGFKLLVGLSTNSLGILSEAAHSGLDMVAAVITFMAVRIADKPADDQHMYGHGKVENFSALIETVLLLVTCAWIVHESVDRLFFKAVTIDASVWAFAVMLVSVIVDVNRSRMLYRAARKHNSQALEADALHFHTDIWSSSVVLLGLAGVQLSHRFPRLAILEKADAVAALGVALIVIGISFQLGKRTIQALLDAAPQGMAGRIRQEVERLPGVVDCHQVRLRTSGPRLFVDVHVSVDGAQSLQQAHDLTEVIEARIQGFIPQADITVHPEPARPDESGPVA
jgi:cation diffusion facilitator family transporter